MGPSVHSIWLVQGCVMNLTQGQGHSTYFPNSLEVQCTYYSQSVYFGTTTEPVLRHRTITHVTLLFQITSEVQYTCYSQSVYFACWKAPEE